MIINDIWDVDEYGWGCRREYTRIMNNDVHMYIYIIDISVEDQALKMTYPKNMTGERLFNSEYQ